MTPYIIIDTTGITYRHRPEGGFFHSWSFLMFKERPWFVLNQVKWLICNYFQNPYNPIDDSERIQIEDLTVHPDK